MSICLNIGAKLLFPDSESIGTMLVLFPVTVIQKRQLHCCICLHALMKQFFFKLFFVQSSFKYRLLQYSISTLVKYW